MPRLFIYKIKYYGYIKTKFKQYEILNSWKIIRDCVHNEWLYCGAQSKTDFPKTRIPKAVKEIQPRMEM